jgi:LAO/AO transport system kinase
MAPLIERLLAGDPHAVARAISIVESHPSQARRLIAALESRIGQAYRVGVTGPPGAGKSTLVNRLVGEFRSRGRTVAVLAIDPSSARTGGAVLGDRIRMQDHAADRGVFIRSMATRGALGGLAAATADAASVLDAAGFEIVIIETVGVGQAEVDVARAADVSVVTFAPGAGDDVQALKAGVMEIADIFAINKADLPGADHAAATVVAGLGLAVPDGRDLAERRWDVPVLRVSAASGTGVPALADAIEAFRAGDHVSARRRSISGRRHDPVGRPDTTGRAVELALDHVAIATPDGGREAAWFEDMLGMIATAAEALPDHGVEVRFLDGGPARLEIVSPLGDRSPISSFLMRRGPGLHHVAFRVPNLSAALDRLKSHGVRLIDDVPRLGAHGSRVAFLHPSSTHGVLIELVDDVSVERQSGFQPDSPPDSETDATR